MLDKIDTIDALMARYVAGVLPLPARILVETHLAIKDGNRSLVSGMEALAGEALDLTPPIAVPARARRLDAIFRSEARDRVLAAAGEAEGLFPAVLRDFVGFTVDTVPWRTKMPGFREHEIGEIDGCHVTLFWIRPGRKIPAHTHEGSELSLVLDGAFTDSNGRYARGDISVADDTVDHRPRAENDRPCIGFAVTDAPLRLTGPLYQRLSDILGR